MSRHPIAARRRRDAFATLTTDRHGLDRAELASTTLAVGFSSGLYLVFGHPYLARGVLGDLLGLGVLTAVLIIRPRRLRHEAIVCFVGIGIVSAFRPDWPLSLPGIVWWGAAMAAVTAYVAVRQHRLP
ncbi:MAG: hypothetical protein ACRDQW_17850 [Haloechinothrix sp.]